MSDDPQARMRTAGSEFGAALSAVLRLAWRQSCAKQIAEEFGPGPWVLHPDGHVEQPAADAPVAGINRIVWNERPTGNAAGDIDEIVVHGATVHIEQMDARCWWIGIDLPSGAHWAGNFHADSRGRMTFTEQESDLAWHRDDSHAWEGHTE